MTTFIISLGLGVFIGAVVGFLKGIIDTLKMIPDEI
jgi:ABC-type dipeptide/oligopeptide/nickel transport system permease subunit